MHQTKKKMTDYLFQSTLYLISALCYTQICCFFCTEAHFPAVGVSVHPRSSGGREDQGCTKTLKAATQGWRLSLALPPFPSQISFDELSSAVMSTDFSIFLHNFWNCLAN